MLNGPQRFKRFYAKIKRAARFGKEGDGRDAREWEIKKVDRFFEKIIGGN